MGNHFGQKKRVGTRAPDLPGAFFDAQFMLDWCACACIERGSYYVVHCVCTSVAWLSRKEFCTAVGVLGGLVIPSRWTVKRRGGFCTRPAQKSRRCDEMAPFVPVKSEPRAASLRRFLLWRYIHPCVLYFKNGPPNFIHLDFKKWLKSVARTLARFLSEASVYRELSWFLRTATRMARSSCDTWYIHTTQQHHASTTHNRR